MGLIIVHDRFPGVILVPESLTTIRIQNMNSVDQNDALKCECNNDAFEIVGRKLQCTNCFTVHNEIDGYRLKAVLKVVS